MFVLVSGATTRVGQTFVDQHQAQIVPRGVFLVDFPESRSKVEATEEESDRNSFSCNLSVMYTTP